MNYRMSLTGFHNPYEHKDLTAEQFLKIYIESQKKMFKKRDGQGRKRLVSWIKQNWQSQLSFVERLFPDTIKRREG